MHEQIKILKNELVIGIDNEFKILHITDTHLAFDDPGKNSGRYKSFEKAYPGCITDYYFQAVDYARDNSMTIINTGDMIDFLSEKNFDFVDKHFNNLDYFYCAGNHDFCHCVGEAKEDEEYKQNNLLITAPHFRNNLIFDSRIINGVNFISLDNSYYRINDYQLEQLKNQASLGLPMILCVHIPFFTQKLADYYLAQGNSSLCMIAAEQKYLDKYSEYRRIQQSPDEATVKAVDYIKNEPLIKAVIAGHLHTNAVDYLENGVPQFITNGTFSGVAREITIR